MAKNNEEVKVCSFCGQSISEDSDIKLIKAPKYTGLANDVYICSDCIKVCSSIIEEEEEDDEDLEGIPDYKNLKLVNELSSDKNIKIKKLYTQTTKDGKPVYDVIS